MSNIVLYHCSHQETPSAPLSPVYASSSADFSPLTSLYFCEECDAVRCDQCVAVEIANYFCPNCLFDVPGANVRGDKNRCARSCFSCPQCTTSLAIFASDNSSEISGSTEPVSSSSSPIGAPYFLLCPACKWSSREIGWLFDKPSGLASQLSKVNPEQEIAQAEFDSLKAHLDAYVTSAPNPAVPRATPGHHRTPSRHIAQLTQAASRVLRRETPGKTAGTSRGEKRLLGKGNITDREKVGWDELAEYRAKQSWKQQGLERGLDDVEQMKQLQREDIASLEKRWAVGWAPPRMASSSLPERIPLQAKLTKRCPLPTCRHVLIQPDTKSVRLKIKMVANNYLPAIELGRRRRRVASGDFGEGFTEEDLERRRKERRRTRGGLGREEDEDLSMPLRSGESYSFELAFTNPLYDPIQIRLSNAHQTRPSVPVTHHVHIPTAHFTVAALKEAWTYDDEDDDEPAEGDDNIATDEVGGTIGKKSRPSLLAGSMRDRHRGRDTGIEKRANVTKVGLDVDVAPGADGPIEFDLEVRFTYRAEEGTLGKSDGGNDARGNKDEFKTFTFWIRVYAGDASQDRGP